MRSSGHPRPRVLLACAPSNDTRRGAMFPTLDPTIQWVEIITLSGSLNAYIGAPEPSKIVRNSGASGDDQIVLVDDDRVRPPGAEQLLELRPFFPGGARGVERPEPGQAAPDLRAIWSNQQQRVSD